jgi:error-prone DNA polymerase
LATQSSRQDRPASLFDAHARRELGPLPIPEEYDQAELIEDEIRAFGFPLRCHPLDLCTVDPVVPIVDASELDKHVGDAVTLHGWLLTEKPAETRHGEPMIFLTFEDRTALYDVTMFPQAFRRYSALLQSHTGYVVYGRVESAFGVDTVTLCSPQRLSVLGQWQGSMAHSKRVALRSITIFISPGDNR